jgi:hypothetical protein
MEDIDEPLMTEDRRQKTEDRKQKTDIIIFKME